MYIITRPAFAEETDVFRILGVWIILWKKESIWRGWGGELFLPRFLNVTWGTFHRSDWYFLFNISLNISSRDSQPDVKTYTF